MSGSTSYRPSRRKLLVVSGALLVAAAAFWLFSDLAIDHVYGAIAAAAGAGGLLLHFLRPPLDLRPAVEALYVAGRPVAWTEVYVSELKERRRGSLRAPMFELVVKDPESDTGRRTIEVQQFAWPGFDELYDALRSSIPRAGPRAPAQPS